MYSPRSPSCSSHTRPTLSRGELLWCAPMLTPPPHFVGRRRIGASQSSPRVWCCSGGGVLGVWWLVGFVFWGGVG